MVNLTSNFDFNKPEVDSATDADQWGTQLNANWDSIDSLLVTWTQNVSAADYTLSRPILKDYGETATNPSSSSNAITLDIENGNHFYTTLTENTTATFSNPTASGSKCAFTWNVAQDGTGSRAITWPASVDWGTIGAPTQTTTADKMDVYYFETLDGGTNWLGAVVAQGAVKNFS